MHGIQPHLPTNRHKPRPLVRAAHLLTVIGLFATALVVGPASANDDQPSVAIRSLDHEADASDAATEAASGTDVGQVTASQLDDVAKLSRSVRGLSANKAAVASEVNTAEVNAAQANLAESASTTASSKQASTSEATTEPPKGAIADVDLAPEARPDFLTIEANSPSVAIDVLENDTYTLLTDLYPFDAVGGEATCDLDGCYFAVDPGFVGTASFGYVLVDIVGDPDTIVTIEVLPENTGPFPPLRSFTTYYGAEPLVIDLVEGVVDPDGDSFVVERAQMVEGVGSLEIVGDDLIYTPPTELVLNPFAGIDVFYRDERGGFGVGAISIVIERLNDPGPVCGEVELFTDQLLANRPGQDVAFIIPEIELGCPSYYLEMISSDPLHEFGYQPTQRNESWFVEGINAEGSIVYTSFPTFDLPEDERESSLGFDQVDPEALGIVGWQIRHVGQGGVNSVHATLRLVPAEPFVDPTPVGCESILLFNEQVLLNRGDENQAISTSFTPPPCNRSAAVFLTSTDFGHRAGHQSDQTEEVWFLEALDIDGNLLFTIDGPSDLADDQVYGDDVAFDVDLSQVWTWRVRHGATGDNINSIQASVEIFFVN